MDEAYSVVHFMFHPFDLETTLGVILPDGSAQHRGISIDVQRPRLDRCM